MKLIKKNILFSLIGIAFFVLASCSPSISVKVNENNSIDISFKTGFSSQVNQTIKTIAGLSENEQLLSPTELSKFLVDAGAVKVNSEIASENELKVEGNLPLLETSTFYTTNILKRNLESILANGNSKLTLTLGPNEIISLYNLLDEDTKAYFDMMMIPALIGEKMDSTEYKTLLSAMYGPTFAEEIANGIVSIHLESPNKKVLDVKEKLGDILTLTSEKTWVIEW